LAERDLIYQGAQCKAASHHCTPTVMGYQTERNTMTMALCLYCGKTKFGALVPCPYCHIKGTGNIMLDIKFSDHHFSNHTLLALGAAK
jgi:hypothetical protein